MIKQLVTCMLFSFSFISAANTAVPSEVPGKLSGEKFSERIEAIIPGKRSEKLSGERLSDRMKTAITNSATKAHAALVEKVEEGKKSLTTENAFNFIKNSAQATDEALKKISAKQAILCTIGVVFCFKHPHATYKTIEVGCNSVKWISGKILGEKARAKMLLKAKLAKKPAFSQKISLKANALSKKWITGKPAVFQNVFVEEDGLYFTKAFEIQPATWGKIPTFLGKFSKPKIR